ncbi:MAG: SPFH domain-containing protein [Alistipes sp.]|nr:SPFH domain-containing protein [Alistipes sp.]
MAIIDLVRWAPQGGETIYAWRHPQTNLSTYTQLIVQESQEALLFSKGQLVGKFGPGKYTLNTENLPILRSLFGIPFGGKNPFTAEVWFVNKVQTFSIQWHIDSMSIHDAGYNTHIPITARGQYGLNVIDSERFIIKLVGTKQQFTEHDFTTQFEGEFTTKVKSIILQYMMQNNYSFKQISAFLAQMSDHLKLSMSPFCQELGLNLSQFFINTIEIDDSTPEGQRVKEAITKQAEMSIIGNTWQQEQMFNTTNNAIEGLTSAMGGNGGGGILGGILAINMMNGMGAGGGMGAGIAQGMMQPQYNQPSFSGNNNMQGAPQGGMQGGMPMQQGAPQQKMVHCSNCAHRYPNTSRFCPKCGDEYNPCPKCGTDNDKSARRCVGCGTQIQAAGAICPNCNSAVAQGAAFCGNCGTRLGSTDVCARCGNALSPAVKFCPVCGNKR